MMMINASRIRTVLCYGGSTRSCDITEKSLPELSSSVQCSRGRNLHNSSQVLCWVMLFGLVLEPPAELQPSQAASHTTGIQKPLRALSVTDTPANCWPLKPFIQYSLFGHRAAVAGSEREIGGGMSSPQGIIHSTRTLVCPSAQSIPYANTNLLGQWAHTAGCLYTPGIHTKTHAHSPQAYRNSHYICIHRENACELAKNTHELQLYLQAELSCTYTHMHITHLQTLSPRTLRLFPLPCICWLSLKDSHIPPKQINLCSTRHREPHSIPHFPNDIPAKFPHGCKSLQLVT